MSALSDFKSLFAPGAEFAFTNHYITRPDHPSFGTTQRRVVRATGSSAYLEFVDGRTVRGRDGLQQFKFPRAAQLLEEIGPDGRSWKVLGGGASQQPDELFLTIRMLRGSVRFCIDEDCPSCGFPERWLDHSLGVFGCNKCDYTSTERAS